MSSPCVIPVNFPAAIDNRPSLPRIQYRIGRYSDFRAQMLSLLDRSPLLKGWTHRQPDDPGIALLEGAAILGDILTFYQELYANEAWLRTATWPQSIAGLVRLLGYRPAPGLGGIGFVAFEISGNSPATVPAGFPFSSQIVGMPAPADFETSQSIVALPGLSRFSLYAPSHVPGIYVNQSVFAVAAADLAAAGVTLKANDRLMMVADSNVANRQISVIKSVSTQLDQTVITLVGTWQPGDVSGTMTAYKLGRTFRAFGYNAPESEFVLKTDNTLTTQGVDTRMPYPEVLQGFPLERRVDDLSAGITMLLDLQVKAPFGHPPSSSNHFLAMTALSVSSGAESVGPMTGGITSVAFEPPEPPPTWPYYYAEQQSTDRRTALCHEVKGSAFSVSSVRQLVPAADTSELDYFGDGISYEALDGRLLQFVSLNPDDTASRVEEATASIERSEIGDPAAVGVRRLNIAPALTEFTLADFPLSNPAIVVFGNVAPMTQGKTQALVPLGNGDSRQIYQSFKLPKAPLTWLLDEALTPPREPGVTILIDEIEWTEVESLFASGPKDQVYILREDNSGNTWVQFGDGVNGAVLPSGVGNVTAQYRTGNGANGWRQSGTKPQPNGRVQNLGQIRLYDEITQGTADEDASHVRQTAPGRVEELGRIVTLSDFEYEAMALPGVEKALAVWDTQENIPLLTLTVLLSDNTPPQVSTVQTAMSQANALRGADRFPVLVLDASLEYVYLAATIGLLPGYQIDPVTAAVTAALGVLPSDGTMAPAGGLFSVDQRSLGEEEYASRIEGTIQNVEGVDWAEVTALGSLGTAEDPSTLGVSAPPTLSPTISCANNRVLALYAAHFTASVGDA
jgi:predicted phage baseplate assembly protein